MTNNRPTRHIGLINQLIIETNLWFFRQALFFVILLPWFIIHFKVLCIPNLKVFVSYTTLQRCNISFGKNKDDTPAKFAQTSFIRI
jgi:hypothetical protein